MALLNDIHEQDEDPASSIIGRAPQGAYPGLDIEVEAIDPALGSSIVSLTAGLVNAVLQSEGVKANIDGELYVRLVDNAEMQALNRDHRGKDKPTNVLSFQAIESEDLTAALADAASSGPPIFFGDIIVAVPVVIAEAEAQNKLPIHHFSHLLVHGLLHLLGYDHMEDQDAEEMEAKERKVLATLGVADPYASERDHG